MAVVTIKPEKSSQSRVVYSHHTLMILTYTVKLKVSNGILRRPLGWLGWNAASFLRRDHDLAASTRIPGNLLASILFLSDEILFMSEMICPY
jgi:hypothetical protein